MQMKAVSRLLSSFAARRFATARLRFQTAVITGFLIVFAAGAAIGPITAASHADDGFLSFFTQHSWNEHEVPAAPVVRAAAARPTKWRSHGVRLAAASVRHHHRPRAAAAAPADMRQAICVRLCDGFSFPVGNFSSSSRSIETQEAMCRSDCPDSETALFVLPKGSDNIEEAVSARDDDKYSELPGASRFKNVRDEACTCHRASPLEHTMSVLRDLTLKRGDAVMTPTGVKVFHGGASFPHLRSDFVALAQSRDVVKSKRADFDALEKASRDQAAPKGPANDALMAPDAPKSRVASRDHR